MKFVAKTFFGLQDVLAKEIEALGGTDIVPLKRAVQFEGDKELLYRLNYESRTALRILWPFKTFKTKHDKHFYKKMYETDWSKYLSLDDTFAIDAVTQSKYITHSKYLALKAKDAIVDQFRENTGLRPNVNTQSPTLRLNVHISRDNLCTLSWDSSGDSLHKRGYRIDTLEAPINEALAAGMVLLSGWEKDCAFLDPMCGSGTIVIEAAMIANNIPPQINRNNFGFQNWRNYDQELWEKVKRTAEEKISSFEYPIIGTDKNFQAIRISNDNALTAGLEGKVSFERKKLESLKRPTDKGVIVMNPPYDERLEELDINGLYQLMGDTFKQEFSGWQAWVISSNMEALKQIGLRPSRKIPLFNGSLECSFRKFEMYAGSKKAKKQVQDEANQVP